MIFEALAAENKAPLKAKIYLWRPIAELERDAVAALANRDYDLALLTLRKARILADTLIVEIDPEVVEFPLQ